MAWTTHPLVLLASLAAGGVAGLVSPAWAEALGVPGVLAGRLLEMAALPLLVVAAAFGLRNVAGLPHRGWRLAAALGAAAVATWLSGLAGALSAAWLAPGQALDDGAQRALGQLVQQVGAAAEGTELLLRAPPAAPVAPADNGLPDNPFAPLVAGDLPAMLWCTLLLALPFALMPRERSQALAQVLEGGYRALERLIALSNHLLPLLAFGMAAHLCARLSADALRLLAPLLAAQALACAGVGGLALAVVARQAGVGTGAVLRALRAPLLVALLAPSPAAAVPGTIEALSGRLGLSRGVTELVVPTGSALLAAGSALQAALVGVFVAQLYQVPLGLPALAWIGTLAAVAALLVRADTPATALAPAACLLLWLRLPGEAVLPLLLLVDGLSRGARQVTLLCCVAATCAVLGRGLPSERREHDDAPATPGRPWRLQLSRGAAALALACVLGAGLLAALAGVGVGLRAQPPHPLATGGPR